MYAFSHKEGLKLAKEEFTKRIRKALNYDKFKEEDIDLHLIRDVSPTSRMYCVTFRLPKEVAYMEKGKETVECLEKEFRS